MTPPKAAALEKVAGMRKKPPATSRLAYMIWVTWLIGKNLSTPRKYSAIAKTKATKSKTASPRESSIRSLLFNRLPSTRSGMKNTLPRRPTKETKSGWNGSATNRPGQRVSKIAQNCAHLDLLASMGEDHRKE